MNYFVKLSILERDWDVGSWTLAGIAVSYCLIDDFILAHVYVGSLDIKSGLNKSSLSRARALGFRVCKKVIVAASRLCLSCSHR